jgi:hypothetical protein
LYYSKECSICQYLFTKKIKKFGDCLVEQSPSVDGSTSEEDGACDADSDKGDH